MEVRPGNRTTIYTDAGAVITVVAGVDGGAATVALDSTAIPGGTSGIVDTVAGASLRAPAEQGGVRPRAKVSWDLLGGTVRGILTQLLCHPVQHIPGAAARRLLSVSDEWLDW